MFEGVFLHWVVLGPLGSPVIWAHIYIYIHMCIYIYIYWEVRVRKVGNFMGPNDDSLLGQATLVLMGEWRSGSVE